MSISRCGWATGLLVALLFMNPPVLLATERGFQAEYRAYYGAMRGASTRFWLEAGDNGEWLWQSRSEPAGVVSMFRDDVVTERSRFRLEDGRIQALSYRYRHQEDGDTRRQRQLDFDWTKQRVRYRNNGDSGETALVEGALDRFLAQYALMRDLEQGRRPDSYVIVDKDERFRQELVYQGEEGLRTRAGRFQTLRIAMQDADSERELRLWLAPELGYLPVKLEQREPGETTVRMELESSNRERKDK